jgi:type II secretory pathway component PulK
MGRNILTNKDGVVLIIALLMLLILTLIGISSISTTTYETKISGNERVGADAFYVSEAGAQVAYNQIPDNINAIPKTQLKEDSYYWTKPIQSFGFYQKPGYDINFAFNRFQVNATGESFGAMKEIEVQVSYGPFSYGTQY